MELISELFPAPVAPEMRTWGISPRLAMRVLPEMSRPNGTSKGCVELAASSEASRSPNATSVRCRLGTSTPMAERPGIGARMRTSGEAMA